MTTRRKRCANVPSADLRTLELNWLIQSLLDPVIPSEVEESLNIIKSVAAP